ncbi:MAG: sensory rhodopsin transducer [Actinobacteria bacterium]|nr:sensory rhodopsin transducer [Actinomycetota bacterium]
MEKKDNIKRGSKTWYVADGWIPAKEVASCSNLEGHESLMVLNCQDKDAEILIDIYFEDKEPIENIKLLVPARRIKCFRMDKPHDIGNVEIPRLTQYALRIKSNVEVIVQFGRMDVTQPNLAYVDLMAFPV